MTALTLKMDTQCQFINFITWCYIYCVNHFCPKLLEMAKFCFLKWLLNELYLSLDLINWFVQKNVFDKILSESVISWNEWHTVHVHHGRPFHCKLYILKRLNEWMDVMNKFSVILSYIYTHIYINVYYIDQFIWRYYCFVFKSCFRYDVKVLWLLLTVLSWCHFGESVRTKKKTFYTVKRN